MWNAALFRLFLTTIHVSSLSPPLPTRPPVIPSTELDAVVTIRFPSLPYCQGSQGKMQ